MLGPKLKHVSKRGPRPQCVRLPVQFKYISMSYCESITTLLILILIIIISYIYHCVYENRIWGKNSNIFFCKSLSKSMSGNSSNIFFSIFKIYVHFIKFGAEHIFITLIPFILFALIPQDYLCIIWHVPAQNCSFLTPGPPFTNMV